jgi:CheY-like chemotaxis protein
VTIDLRVLIANDDEMNVMIFFEMLRSLGIDPEMIDVASNGREAFQKATKFHYDLILMDLEMPLMNGFDSCSQIKEAFSGKYLSRAKFLGLESQVRELVDQLRPYIVAVTGFEVSDPTVTGKLKQMRFNDWFTSPIGLEIIQRKIIEKVMSINQKSIVK